MIFLFLSCTKDVSVIMVVVISFQILPNRNLIQKQNKEIEKRKEKMKEKVEVFFRSDINVSFVSTTVICFFFYFLCAWWIMDRWSYVMCVRCSICFFDVECLSLYHTKIVVFSVAAVMVCLNTNLLCLLFLLFS